jgi:hypothetical protein
MARYTHDMGMSLKESLYEFQRILSALGFKLREKKRVKESVLIVAERRGEVIELTFTPARSRLMGIPRTIVEISTSQTTHELIQERIVRMRCGG